MSAAPLATGSTLRCCSWLSVNRLLALTLEALLRTCWLEKWSVVDVFKDPFCFCPWLPSPGGSGGESGLSCPLGNRGFWADSGPDPGENLFVIFMLALSAVGTPLPFGILGLDAPSPDSCCRCLGIHCLCSRPCLEGKGTWQLPFDLYSAGEAWPDGAPEPSIV